MIYLKNHECAHSKIRMRYTFPTIHGSRSCSMHWHFPAFKAEVNLVHAKISVGFNKFRAIKNASTVWSTGTALVEWAILLSIEADESTLSPHTRG